MMDAPLLRAFKATVGLLESVGCGYALVGALARAAWGTGRTTTDADFAVAATAADVSRIKMELECRGLALFRQLGPYEPADDLPNLLILNLPDNPAVHADLLVAKTEFERQAVARKRRIVIAGLACWVITPEDLIIYKLIAHRGRDRDDILDVLKTRQLAGEVLDLAHVEHWAREWSIEDRWEMYRPGGGGA